jgi:hypothetical protein
VLLEAVGFAFLAAVNPSALLIGAAYLGSANPRKTVVFYLAGAIIMTAVLGVVILVAIRAGGLSQVGNRTPRYGLRLGLGAVALVGAVVVARRQPKTAPGPAGEAGPKQGRLARLIARPSPLTAAAVGILLFYPSAGLIAAVQVIATSHDSLGLEALGVALVVLVDVLSIWMPLLVYLIAPDATTRALRGFDEWLRARKRTITIVALAAVGVILIVNGSLGLAGLTVVGVAGDGVEDRRFASEQRCLAHLLLDRRGRHRVAEEQQQRHRLDDDRRPDRVEGDLAPVIQAVQDGRD